MPVHYEPPQIESECDQCRCLMCRVELGLQIGVRRDGSERGACLARG